MVLLQDCVQRHSRISFLLPVSLPRWVQTRDSQASWGRWPSCYVLTLTNLRPLATRMLVVSIAPAASPWAHPLTCLLPCSAKNISGIPQPVDCTVQVQNRPPITFSAEAIKGLADPPPKDTDLKSGVAYYT